MAHPLLTSSALPSVALAPLVALSADLTGANEIQLLPAGEFRAWDGRPKDAPLWRLDAALAANLIAWQAARNAPSVIDYDHQTLRSEKNGQPSPAAGWYSALEFRPDVGLFAVGVEWTAAAAEHIAAGEYRFISPVITYDKAGNVTGLYMASLTNFPAIDGMDEVLLAAASALFPSSNQPVEENMDELLEQLRWLLNLPVGATADDVKAQLQKLMDQLGQTQTAAASFDLAGHIAALSAKADTPVQPDPAAFVPMAQFIGLQNEFASLSAKIETGEHAATLEAALADGRILPAHADYWKAQPLAALSSFVAQAKPIAALTGTQTGGHKPAGSQTAALSAEASAVCAQFGLKPEEYQATLAASA